MKPIKLYFAAAWAGGGKGEVNLIEAGIKNKLVSYVYPTQLTGWCDNLTKEQEGDVMVDSGAFSVWNKGTTIDLTAYIAYARSAIERVSKFPNQRIHIVNLDVIPGIVGQTHSLNKNRKSENLDLIDAAAQQGFKNMQIMLKNGIKPIHVFHQGESLKWLDRMVQHTDYIGISPANDLDTRTRNAWIESVFLYLDKHQINVDTHGFAVTNRKTLLRFPWTSCDAASWRLSAGMGNIYYPAGGFSNPDYSIPVGVYNVSAKKVAKGIKHITPYFLKQIEADGLTYELLQDWKERTKVNIRYFLGLEKWLNEQKAKMEFHQRNTLGF